MALEKKKPRLTLSIVTKLPIRNIQQDTQLNEISCYRETTGTEFASTHKVIEQFIVIAFVWHIIEHRRN